MMITARRRNVIPRHDQNIQIVSTTGTEAGDAYQQQVEKFVPTSGQQSQEQSDNDGSDSDHNDDDNDSSSNTTADASRRTSSASTHATTRTQAYAHASKSGSNTPSHRSQSIVSNVSTSSSTQHHHHQQQQKANFPKLGNTNFDNGSGHVTANASPNPPPAALRNSRNGPAASTSYNDDDDSDEDETAVELRKRRAMVQNLRAVSIRKKALVFPESQSHVHGAASASSAVALSPTNAAASSAAAAHSAAVAAGVAAATMGRTIAPAVAAAIGASNPGSTLLGATVAASMGGIGGPNEQVLAIHVDDGSNQKQQLATPTSRTHTLGGTIPTIRQPTPPNALRGLQQQQQQQQQQPYPPQTAPPGGGTMNPTNGPILEGLNSPNSHLFKSLPPYIAQSLAVQASHRVRRSPHINPISSYSTAANNDEKERSASPTNGANESNDTNKKQEDESYPSYLQSGSFMWSQIARQYTRQSELAMAGLKKNKYRTSARRVAERLYKSPYQVYEQERRTAAQSVQSAHALSHAAIERPNTTGSMMTRHYSTMNDDPTGGKFVSERIKATARRLLESTNRYTSWYADMAAVAVKIFKGKCEDVNIMPTRAREEKFVKNCMHFCRQGRFVLIETGIGPSAAKHIAKLLLYKIAPEQVHDAVYQANLESDLNKLAHDPNATIAPDATSPIIRPYQVVLPAAPSSSTPSDRPSTSGGDTDPPPIMASLQSSGFTSLDLSGNCIGDEGATHIAQSLRSAPALTHVNVSSNQITGVGLEQIFLALVPQYQHHTSSSSSSKKQLKSCSVVTELNVSSPLHKNNMYIGPGLKAAEALKRCLMTNPTVRILNLQNTGLGLVPGCVALLAAGLCGNSALQTLDVSGNHLSFRDAQLISDALTASKTPTLETLLLRNNQLGSAGMSAIADNLRNVHTLVRVDLTKNDAYLCGWLLLSDAIAMNPVIDKLVLDHNDFSTSPSMAYISERRGRAPEEVVTILLEKIKLQYLRDRYVSHKLASNCSLRTLSLNHCGLKDKFMFQFAEILIKQSSLTSLSLAHNVIREDGAIVLAQYLNVSQTLQHIDLSNNGINDTGGRALAESLQHNSILMELDVHNNDFGDTAAKALIVALNNNPQLIACNVDGNKIPYRIYRDVCDAAAKNKRVRGASAVHRKVATIAFLSESESILNNTESKIQDHIDELQAVQQQLQQLHDIQHTYIRTEEAITEALDMELKQCFSERQKAESADYDCDRDVKRSKAAWEAKLVQCKLNKDKQRDLCTVLQKQLIHESEHLEQARRDAASNFDESSRLLIVLQSTVKRNRATWHWIEQDYKRLQEWCTLLEKKVSYGEINTPHRSTPEDPTSPTAIQQKLKHELANPSTSTSTSSPSPDRRHSVTERYLLPIDAYSDSTTLAAERAKLPLTEALKRLKQEYKRQQADAAALAKSAAMNKRGSTTTPSSSSSLGVTNPATPATGSPTIPSSPTAATSTTGTRTLLRPKDPNDTKKKGSSNKSKKKKKSSKKKKKEGDKETNKEADKGSKKKTSSKKKGKTTAAIQTKAPPNTGETTTAPAPTATAATGPKYPTFITNAVLSSPPTSSNPDDATAATANRATTAITVTRSDGTPTAASSTSSSTSPPPPAPATGTMTPPASSNVLTVTHSTPSTPLTPTTDNRDQTRTPTDHASA